MSLYLKKKYSSPDEITINTYYFELFKITKTIVNAFGFSEILFLVDEFERSFQKFKLDDSSDPFKIPFNNSLKEVIEGLIYYTHFILAGTDAIQMAFAGGNGTNSIPVITRSLNENIYSTSKKIDY